MDAQLDKAPFGAEELGQSTARLHPRPRTRFLMGLLHAAFNLPFVIGAIEVAPRLGYESIVSNLPYLEAADANPLPGPARPGVGADECPVVPELCTQRAFRTAVALG